ncbi:sugar ABC transporter ATP-binding protein [Niveibacterium microcysteis]|nr:sugar ABC transporter ATP-binding protein [Niveibacterium microcysteis]
MMPPTPPLLHGTGLGKRYATPVLSDVSFTLHAGEVLALTGENGAGKSTLSKIIAGLIPPSEGQLELAGQAYRPQSRRDAESQGVRMVLQELGLVPTLTVAENLLLDHLPRRAGFIRRDALNQQAAAQMAAIGLSEIDPRTPVGELGVGHQQMVEIARSLVGDCRILILDEPTATLTSREIEHLFRQIALLKARGVGIIYISHRLDEVQQIADRVMVLRDGKHIDTQPMAGMTQDDIVRRMVGRDVREELDRARRPAGSIALEVRGLSRGKFVKDVSFDVAHGEVLGIAGLVGAGRTELLRLIYGADRADAGEIRLNGEAKPRPVRSPMEAVRHGIGLVTEDRKAQGLMLPLPIRVNATLARIADVAHRGWLDRARERNTVEQLRETLGVRCNSIEQAVGELSGGNQQKVVFARWLHRDSDVLLLDEPTRGVDIGARADIYAQMDRLAAAGKALVMVSSDLRELMSVCDRIAVMSAGRLVRVFERGEWSQHALLEAAFSGYSAGHASATTETPTAAEHVY